VKELKAKSSVKVLLDPPRASVEIGPNPVKGPATAPVTIVEFSDYQCPYCSRVEATLKQLEDKYGDKLRLAFRDFPLVDIHKDASRAAEAAACANEQGKFWEMHDKMFANQGGLSADGLKKMAAEIGLSADPFAACLDSGKNTATWKAETAVAVSHGVTATPGFFINGRFLNGAVPIEQFSQIIDDELDRAGTPSK
jgi:protein-disulfide isomerase